MGFHNQLVGLKRLGWPLIGHGDFWRLENRATSELGALEFLLIFVYIAQPMCPTGAIQDMINRYESCV